MRILTILVAAALVAPAAALAQSPEDRIEQARQRALQAGLPIELVQSKVDEGVAKGVPAARIADAVERRLEAGMRARDAMDRRDLSAADVAVAADALLAGVSETALGTIAATAPRERRAVAIAVLTHLVNAGHVPAEALDRVTEALRRGPDALLNLPAQAAEAAARRGPPSGAGGPPAGVGGTGGPPSGVPAPGQRGRRGGGGG
jgi:hypothetical protein